MKKPKHKLYLNPHDEYKWTKCPKCDRLTKVRKRCLVTHYENKAAYYRQLCVINKSVKYCKKCDLFICQRSELQRVLRMMLPKPNLSVEPENFFVFGTMERKDWLTLQKDSDSERKAFDFITPFKDHLDFEIQPAGWYFEGK